MKCARPYATFRGLSLFLCVNVSLGSQTGSGLCPDPSRTAESHPLAFTAKSGK